MNTGSDTSVLHRLTEAARPLVAAALAGLIAGCAATSERTVMEEQEALALIDRGTLHLRGGRADEAQAAFDVAWELTQKPAALDGLGCVAFLRGDYLAAERIFNQVLQLDPAYSDALMNLAAVYERTERPFLAEQLYARGLDHDPQHFRARNNLAVLLAERAAARPALKEEARMELLRARELVKHPVIDENLRQLE